MLRKGEEVCNALEEPAFAKCFDWEDVLRILSIIIALLSSLKVYDNDNGVFQREIKGKMQTFKP